ncbi:hypothetical protein AGMMS49574_29710 [Bacteroidia bacterium]|nr:hypothetical protein AGMMS49574_29710 [Bacteroidia bacterium]GHV04103.1 hypothetical protein FACS189416_1750 [Bacteroidia bacterium]
MHNPAFKGVEFDTFLHEAGATRFNMTPRPVAMYRQTMSESQLSRLNSIEVEKGFRKLGASAGNEGLKPAPGTEE